MITRHPLDLIVLLLFLASIVFTDYQCAFASLREIHRIETHKGARAQREKVMTENELAKIVVDLCLKIHPIETRLLDQCMKKCFVSPIEG